MGMILCEDHEIRHPYYFEPLGIHLYSKEELCYVIHELPLLCMDELVGEQFFDFLKNELEMGLYALKIEQRLNDRLGDCDDVLLAVLDSSDYYSKNEISRYKTQLTQLRSLKKHELEFARGNQLYELGRYGKAIRHYENALRLADESRIENLFHARVCCNTGNAYANMFESDKAFEYYVRSYELNPDKTVLRNIYYMAWLEPVVDKKQKYLAYLPEEGNPEWDADYEAKREAALQSASIAELENACQKDSVRKVKLLKNISADLKKQYRNMI